MPPCYKVLHFFRTHVSRMTPRIKLLNARSEIGRCSTRRRGAPACAPCVQSACRECAAARGVAGQPTRPAGTERRGGHAEPRAQQVDGVMVRDTPPRPAPLAISRAARNIFMQVDSAAGRPTDCQADHPHPNPLAGPREKGSTMRWCGRPTNSHGPVIKRLAAGRTGGRH